MNIKEESDQIPQEAILSFDKSIEKSAKVIKNYPGSAYVDDAIFLIGRCYYEKGDYSRAIKKFEELRILFPDSRFNEDGTYYQALSYLANNNYAMAIRYFGQVGKKWEKESKYKIAVCYFRSKNYKKTIDRLKGFIQEFPNSEKVAQAYLKMGESYAHLGKMDSMNRYFQEFFNTARTAEKTDSVRIEVVRIMGRKGQIDQGIEILGDVNKDSLLLIKVELLMMQRSYQRAEDILQYIISSDTLETVGEAYYRLALLYEEKSDFVNALAFYDSSINRGLTQAYMIDAERRRSTLNKTLELKENPGEDPAQAKFLLAEIYFLNLDNFELAIQTYQQVADSFPDSDFAPKSLYAIGWIEKNVLNDDGLADQTYDTLVKRYPNSIFAHEINESRESNN